MRMGTSGSVTQWSWLGVFIILVWSVGAMPQAVTGVGTADVAGSLHAVAFPATPRDYQGVMVDGRPYSLHEVTESYYVYLLSIGVPLDPEGFGKGVGILVVDPELGLPASDCSVQRSALASYFEARWLAVRNRQRWVDMSAAIFLGEELRRPLMRGVAGLAETIAAMAGGLTYSALTGGSAAPLAADAILAQLAKHSLASTLDVLLESSPSDALRRVTFTCFQEARRALDAAVALHDKLQMPGMLDAEEVLATSNVLRAWESVYSALDAFNQEIWQNYGLETAANCLWDASLEAAISGAKKLGQLSEVAILAGDSGLTGEEKLALRLFVGAAFTHGSDLFAIAELQRSIMETFAQRRGGFPPALAQFVALATTLSEIAYWKTDLVARFPSFNELLAAFRDALQGVLGWTEELYRYAPLRMAFTLQEALYGQSCDAPAASMAVEHDEWDYEDDSADGATGLTPTIDSQSHGPHTLNVNDHYDWFGVALVEGRRYAFSTTGNCDTYGQLFDSASTDNELDCDDDGGDDLNFRLEFEPAASGTYFLRVRAFEVGSVCTYALVYGQVDDAVRGDHSVIRPAPEEPSLSQSYALAAVLQDMNDVSNNECAGLTRAASGDAVYMSFRPQGSGAWLLGKWSIYSGECLAAIGAEPGQIFDAGHGSIFVVGRQVTRFYESLTEPGERISPPIGDLATSSAGPLAGLVVINERQYMVFATAYFVDDKPAYQLWFWDSLSERWGGQVSWPIAGALPLYMSGSSNVLYLFYDPETTPQPIELWEVTLEGVRFSCSKNSSTDMPAAAQGYSVRGFLIDRFHFGCYFLLQSKTSASYTIQHYSSFYNDIPSWSVERTPDARGIHGQLSGLSFAVDATGWVWAVSSFLASGPSSPTGGGLDGDVRGDQYLYVPTVPVVTTDVALFAPSACASAPIAIRGLGSHYEVGRGCAEYPCSNVTTVGRAEFLLTYGDCSAAGEMACCGDYRYYMSLTGADNTGVTTWTGVVQGGHCGEWKALPAELPPGMYILSVTVGCVSVQRVLHVLADRFLFPSLAPDSLWLIAPRG